MDKVVFLLGPTGVGKSDMAINLAKAFNGEIISADSVQIYKGFDIGSAKITKDEMQGIVHHCIDICMPNNEFSVYDYVKLTLEKIREINQRKKMPIVVGGTGLYIKALVEGYNYGGTEKNQDFRDEMSLLFDEIGGEELWKQLNEKAPLVAEKISPNDKKRIIRAFELLKFGSAQEKKQCDIDYKLLALTLDRALLYERINNRVDIMLRKGLVSEVRSLLSQNVNPKCQPMQAIGYKEVVNYLNGESDADSMAMLIKQHSRNYAKRQFTFLRGMSDVIYVDSLDREKAYLQIANEIKEWL